jgi:hypothetical protein
MKKEVILFAVLAFVIFLPFSSALNQTTDYTIRDKAYSCINSKIQKNSCDKQEEKSLGLS